jgi:hypothetical protein
MMDEHRNTDRDNGYGPGKEQCRMHWHMLDKLDKQLLKRKVNDAYDEACATYCAHRSSDNGNASQQ